jgi:hypothetical protein
MTTESAETLILMATDSFFPPPAFLASCQRSSVYPCAILKDLADWPLPQSVSLANYSAALRQSSVCVTGRRKTNGIAVQTGISK